MSCKTKPFGLLRAKVLLTLTCVGLLQSSSAHSTGKQREGLVRIASGRNAASIQSDSEVLNASWPGQLQREGSQQSVLAADLGSKVPASTTNDTASSNDLAGSKDQGVAHMWSSLGFDSKPMFQVLTWLVLGIGAALIVVQLFFSSQQGWHKHDDERAAEVATDSWSLFPSISHRCSLFLGGYAYGSSKLNQQDAARSNAEGYFLQRPKLATRPGACTAWGKCSCHAVIYEEVPRQQRQTPADGDLTSDSDTEDP